MKCFYHTSIDAVGICKSCAKGVCADCATDVGKGLACKSRCEDDVKRIVSLIENNAKLQAATKRARFLGPTFLMGLGAIFLYYGVTEQSLVNFTSLSGAGFFLFGIAVLIFNLRYSKQLKTE